MKIEKQIALFSIGMAFIAWMVVKLPMPALPYLSQVFGTASQNLKFSITLTLIAFGVSQIFWGPLSERFGRKHILITAFSLAAFGSAVTMLAINIDMYIIGRFLEGFAVGSAAPLGRAIMSDALDSKMMAKTYAWYAMAGLLPPAVGPVIGGYLLVFIGWRAIFAFALLLSLIYSILCWLYLTETHKNMREKLNPKDVLQDIVFIIKSSQFWGYAATYALINGFMIAYYASMPYWYVVEFHVQESIYGWFAFLPIGSYIIGSLVTNALLNFFSIRRLLFMGLIIALCLSIAILLCSPFITPTVFWLNFFMTLFSFASGVVTPMSNATLMTLFRSRVTTLSALISGLRVSGAGLLVLIAANMQFNSLWYLGTYTLSISLLAIVSYLTCMYFSPSNNS